MAARGSVKAGYGFITHDGKDETIQKNCELHALLVTDGAFMWTVSAFNYTINCLILLMST